ncbi:MAG: TetR/AcrR family transcriptional regulator [Acidimicrobiales bacterium]
MAGTPRRPTGDETRRALKDAALRVFRTRGYQSAGLEEIGRELGITRSAVLFHFGSKADLLREVVEPFETEIDRVLDLDLRLAPLSPPRRRRLIRGVLDCYLEHRDVLRLIAQDVTCHAPLGIDERIAARRARIYHLLAGSAPTPSDAAVIDATLGVLMVPLFSPHFQPTADVLDALVDSAALVVRRVQRVRRCA